jgi:hypothetical protein
MKVPHAAEGFALDEIAVHSILHTGGEFFVSGFHKFGEISGS